MILKLALAAIISTTSVSISAAQGADSTFVASAEKKAMQIYTTSIGANSQLYSGSDYKEYNSQHDESPMLLDDVVSGDVRYKGELYTNVDLYYDLEKDAVLTTYPNGIKVQLIREFVTYFEIAGHRYVRLQNRKIADGFYDRLYDGKLKLYARRSKEHNVLARSGETVHEFVLTVKYFIQKDEGFYSVRGKRSVLNLMPSQKRELKKVIRDENLSFKNDREKAIVRLVQRFEELNAN